MVSNLAGQRPTRLGQPLRPGSKNRHAGTLVRSVVIVAGLILIAGLIAFTLTPKAGNTTESTTGSTSGGSGRVLFSLGPTPLLLGPGITINYTLTLFPFGDTRGATTLTVAQPQGLAFTINPTTVYLNGSDVAVDVRVKASQSVKSGYYPVAVKAAWPTGSSNRTFQFEIVEHLIVMLSDTNAPGPFYPDNLTIRVGSAVTWLSLDGGSDEFGGQRQVGILGLNATSPIMTFNSVWSFTFSQPGTYKINDPLNPNYSVSATIRVE